MIILRDSNIKELEIYLLKGEKIETDFETYLGTENTIYELNLIRIKIDIKSFEFDYQTFFIFLLYNIHFPCLKEYILNFQLQNKLTIEHQNTNFFTVNYLILNNLIKKKSFSLDDFLSMANNLNNIRILQLNLGIFTFEYKNKYKENNYFTLIVNHHYKFANYFEKIDLLINDKILKFKKINIQGLKKLKKQIKLKENSLDNIIEDQNINCCDINLSLNKKEIIIKSLSNLRSIYYDDDIEKTNFFEINIIKNNLSKFQKLKYLNFSIGYIKEFPNDKNLKEDHLYKSLSKLIQNSKNLKSIILRIHPANFNDKIISFYFSLIGNLKKLRTFKLIQNDKYENNHYLSPIIENENFTRRLKEFEIGNKDYEIKRILDNNKIICGFKINKNEEKNEIQILNNFEEIKNKDIFKNGIENEEELKRNCKLYYNNKTLDSFKTNFLKEGEKIIKIEQKSKIRNSNYMFFNCLNLVYLYNFENNILENISNMFYNCSNLSFLDFSKVNGDKINDMSYMFCNCKSLSYINLANLNTKNVDNMCYLFYNCISLQFLDLSNFNTSNVIDMNAMFFSCRSLKSLDLSNFDTCNVKNMKCMFSHCLKLEYLNISSFYINKFTNIDSMFLYCSHLKYLDISNFPTNSIELEKIFKKISNKCKLICYN
jgi:surface protein